MFVHTLLQSRRTSAKMDDPITDQPGGFAAPNKNPDNLAGLEVLNQLGELMIKQRHPGCLECKIT